MATAEAERSATERIEALFEWRMPYTKLRGAEVATETVKTVLGTALHRTVTLSPGGRVPRTTVEVLAADADSAQIENQPQPELVARQDVEIHVYPDKGYLAPVVFGSVPDQGLSFMYWLDLGALSEINDVAVNLPLEPLLCGEGRELGWRGPHLGRDFVARQPAHVSDSYLLLVDEVPDDAQARAELFLRMVAAIQPLVEPDSEPVDIDDLDELVEHSMTWMEQSGHWLSVNNQRFLVAYVGAPTDDGATAEINTPLEILEPLVRFERETGRQFHLSETLRSCISRFWEPSLGTVVVNHPFDDPDSEADSWYLYMVLSKLAELADGGWAEARQLLRDSLSYAIDLAQQMNYEFPVFYRWSDRADLGGDEQFDYEYDTVLGYLYVMVRAYELFGDERCLREAKEAFEHIGIDEFDSVYELHISAMGCAALARLWKLTDDRRYLDAALRPLAYLLAHTTFSQADWACRNGMPTYMAMAAMDYLYPAAMEQHLAAHYLAEWLELGGDAIPDYARRLAETFVRFSGGVVRAMYPDALPPGALCSFAPENGATNDHEAPVPVEDYRWFKLPCALVAQEYYGAGAAPDMALLGRRFELQRSVTGKPAAYPWPRGVSHSPGHTDFVQIHGAGDDLEVDIDAPEGVELRLEHYGDRKVLAVGLPKGLAPGNHECVLWLKEEGQWHPSNFQIHCQGPLRDVGPQILQDAELWSHRFDNAEVEVVEDGLRVRIADGETRAAVGIPHLILPHRTEAVYARTSRVSHTGCWHVRLSGDYNEDGRWPGVHDDWNMPSCDEAGHVREALPPWIKANSGLPLRLLQLVVEGEPGDYAVFSHVAFLLEGARRFA